jgi:hypothetical protein
MTPLEFTTTATQRPDILEQTYASFSKGLKGVDFKSSTLYINIDPLPVKDKSKEIIDVAEKYFGKVIPNIPDEPNFCKAVKWCFAQPQGKMFFHLEDDWEIVRPVNIDDLQKRMFPPTRKVNRRKIVNVILRAHSVLGVNDHRVCLSPSLNRTEWGYMVSRVLDPNHNPEKQLRPRNSKKNPIGGKNPNTCLGMQYPGPKNTIIVRDIGRDWMRKNRIGKKQSKNGFFNRWT